MEFGAIMLWYFVSDRTTILDAGEKTYSRDLFFFLFVILTCVAAGASLQTFKTPLLLNRPQTEEWKGWMQVGRGPPWLRRAVPGEREARNEGTRGEQAARQRAAGGTVRVAEPRNPHVVALSSSVVFAAEKGGTGNAGQCSNRNCTLLDGDWGSVPAHSCLWESMLTTHVTGDGPAMVAATGGLFPLRSCVKQCCPALRLYRC